MTERTEWKGRTYKRYPAGSWKAGRYFHRKVNGRAVFLHREVWEEANGPISEGQIVHHLDGNITNNALDNLVLLSVGEHMSHHIGEWHKTPEGKRQTENFANKRGRYAEIPYYLPQDHVVPISKHCEHCGKDFVDHSPARCARFCSRSCCDKSYHSKGKAMA